MHLKLPRQDFTQVSLSAATVPVTSSPQAQFPAQVIRNCDAVTKLLVLQRKDSNKNKQTTATC